MPGKSKIKAHSDASNNERASLSGTSLSKKGRSVEGRFEKGMILDMSVVMTFQKMEQIRIHL
jgi:TATA-binding protein-associated factor Taf7